MTAFTILEPQKERHKTDFKAPKLRKGLVEYTILKPLNQSINKTSKTTIEGFEGSITARKNWSEFGNCEMLGQVALSLNVLGWIAQFPTDPFTIFEHKYPSFDVPDRPFHDFGASKSVARRS